MSSRSAAARWRGDVSRGSNPLDCLPGHLDDAGLRPYEKMANTFMAEFNGYYLPRRCAAVYFALLMESRGRSRFSCCRAALVERANTTVSTYKRAILDLQEAGFVVRKQRRQEGALLSDFCLFILPQVERFNAGLSNGAHQ